MIQHFILGFLLITLVSCSAQKNITMKNFDIVKFNKNKDHLDNYSYYTNDSVFVEQDKWQFGFEETISGRNDLILTYYKYYENGNLKLSGNLFPNDFEKGIWKEYDEQGKLIKETDYDVPYKFSWEDILQLMEDKNIDLNNQYLRIIRDVVDGQPFWGITWEDIKIGKLRHIGIDGISGEIVQDIIKEYPGGGEYETLPDMEDE